MPEIKISAVIITYNEEKNIGRCITSLEGIADEILVLDSFSSDDTEQICRDKGITFIQRAWQGYSESKNYANSQATYDYILSLDADEALSEDLQSSILQMKKDTPLDGYYMNRLTNYCGQWIHHCGWYPDQKLRLWNRGKGSWQGLIHESVSLEAGSNTTILDGDLLHYSFTSIHDHIMTADKFSRIAAEIAFKNGKKANLLTDIIINPLFTFFRKYFLQLGILDGYYGYIICRMSAFANFLKYSKIRELHRRETRPDSY